MGKGGEKPPTPLPYMPYGGFGQPGVRETKVVGETSEIKIPRKQFFETWIFLFLIFILGYACIKLLIVDRADWSLFIGIATLVFIPFAVLFFERQIAYKFFPRAYGEFLAMMSRIIHTDDAGRFILFAFFVAIILLVSIGFYISTIVPQLTLILDQQAQFVFVFAAFLSLIIAFVPYYKFNRRQLVDSLRDSDSHYATKALELEYAERERRRQSVQALLDAEVVENGRREVVEVLQLHKASAEPTAPLNERQQRFKLAVLDFLDGVDNGWWGTNERSWRGELGERKILEKSRHPLMSIGGTIRDQLIAGGWARWKNPDEPQRGWELLYSTEEIRDGAFDYTGRFNPARDGGIGAAGSEDIIDPDEDRVS